MTYLVQITPLANEDLDAALLWLVQRTEHAWPWYDRVLRSIATLEQFPERCPLAPENIRSKDELRHLIVGDRLHAYRIIFTIRSNVVIILQIIHGARDS